MADESTAHSLLTEEAVRLGATATDWRDAIKQVGALLVDTGATEAGYVDKMIERDSDISTFVGEMVAIPHGTLAGREMVLRDSLAVVQFPDGVDWHGERVELCVGIAAKDGNQVPILSQLAEILMDPDEAARLRSATTAAEVIETLSVDLDGDDDSDE